VQEVEGATMKKAPGGEGCGNSGSVGVLGSVHVSNVGSQSNVDASSHGGPRSHNFGLLTVAVSCIREMTEQHYFVKGGARAPGEQTIMEREDDKVVIFEEFFSARHRMPPHSVLADILLKFQVQLHQLTPNVITRLSKYFCAVASFGGIPSADGFAKRYELHY
jgi:hypothetical protein